MAKRSVCLKPRPLPAIYVLKIYIEDPCWDAHHNLMVLTHFGDRSSLPIVTVRDGDFTTSDPRNVRPHCIKEIFLSLLRSEHAPAQLVEEVEQHRHVNRAFLLAGCLSGLGITAKRLPSGARSAIHANEIRVDDLRIGPEARFVRGEGIGVRAYRCWTMIRLSGGELRRTAPGRHATRSGESRRRWRSATCRTRRALRPENGRTYTS